jgi:hypothetical protein
MVDNINHYRLYYQRGKAMEEKLTTVCFMATTEQKTLLEQWASAEDRSVSYMMRQILKREAQRRSQAQPVLPKPVSQNN